MEKVILKNSKGEVLLEIPAGDFPVHIDAPSCTTVSGRKPYVWKLSYLWNEEEKKKDRTKIRGMVLN